MSGNDKHVHDWKVQSRTMISGDRIEVAYKCDCDATKTEIEYT